MIDPSLTRESCAICGRSDAPITATMPGRRTGATFRLRYCASCGFAWVENPWTDFATVYDEAYYRGQGSDVSIDYVDELEHYSQTVRHWEWKGILQLADELAPGRSSAKAWLDFGCGNGGLLKYVGRGIEGFEEGWAASFGRAHGSDILTREDLAQRQGTYELVTAIEVLEHVLDPREVLREVRALLKPGGRFIFTTGNLAPFAPNLSQWGYVAPEIHISYYEPRALARLLEESGFEPRYAGYRPAHGRIMAYKLLKTLGRRRDHPLFHALPWPLIGKILDQRRKLSAHPYGVAV